MDNNPSVSEQQEAPRSVNPLNSQFQNGKKNASYISPTFYSSIFSDVDVQRPTTSSTRERNAPTDTPTRIVTSSPSKGIRNQHRPADSGLFSGPSYSPTKVKLQQQKGSNLDNEYISAARQLNAYDVDFLQANKRIQEIQRTNQNQEQNAIKELEAQSLQIAKELELKNVQKKQDIRSRLNQEYNNVATQIDQKRKEKIEIRKGSSLKSQQQINSNNGDTSVIKQLRYNFSPNQTQLVQHPNEVFDTKTSDYNIASEQSQNQQLYPTLVPRQEAAIPAEEDVNSKPKASSANESENRQRQAYEEYLRYKKEQMEQIKEELNKLEARKEEEKRRKEIQDKEERERLEIANAQAREEEFRKKLDIQRQLADSYKKQINPNKNKKAL